MHYIIYKTTNLLNNKYYIGKHITENLDDNYLGSGKALVASIRKYGRANFIREILFELESEELMNLKEKELVTEELVNDNMCYNMTLGGEGGPIFKGKHHTDATKQKIREIRKQMGSHKRTEEQKQKERERRYAKNDGKWHSEETKEKLRQIAYLRHGTSPENPKSTIPFKSLSEEEKEQRRLEAKRKRSESLKGHAVTEETREKLRSARKGKVANNKGRVCINDGIKNKFVKAEDLDYYLNNGYKQGGIRKR